MCISKFDETLLVHHMICTEYYWKLVCIAVCVNHSLCPVWTPVYMDRTYIQYTSKTAAFNVFMICTSVQPKLYSAQTNIENTILWWSNTMNLYQCIYMCMGLWLSSAKIIRGVLLPLLVKAEKRVSFQVTISHTSAYHSSTHHCLYCTSYRKWPV